MYDPVLNQIPELTTTCGQLSARFDMEWDRADRTIGGTTGACRKDTADSDVILFPPKVFTRTGSDVYITSLFPA